MTLRTFLVEPLHCNDHTSSSFCRSKRILINPPFENWAKTTFPQNTIGAEVPSSHSEVGIAKSLHIWRLQNLTLTPWSQRRQNWGGLAPITAQVILAGANAFRICACAWNILYYMQNNTKSTRRTFNKTLLILAELLSACRNTQVNSAGFSRHCNFNIIDNSQQKGKGKIIHLFCKRYRKEKTFPCLIFYQ